MSNVKTLKVDHPTMLLLRRKRFIDLIVSAASLASLTVGVRVAVTDGTMVSTMKVVTTVPYVKKPKTTVRDTSRGQITLTL